MKQTDLAGSYLSDETSQGRLEAGRFERDLIERILDPYKDVSLEEQLLQRQVSEELPMTARLSLALSVARGCVIYDGDPDPDED